MRRLVIIVALMLLAVAPTYAQKKTQRGLSPDAAIAKIRVGVAITFESPEASVFKQCLFRELRKIPEVTVVQEQGPNNYFELNVVVIHTLSRGGADIGYASSVVVLSPVDGAMWDPVLKDDADKAKIESFLSAAAYFENQSVLVDPSLNSLCRRIAAEMDTGPIERVREVRQTAK